MIIRRATPDDADEISHVHVEGWRTAYAELLPPDFLAGLSVEAQTAKWLEILRESAVDSATFVAETEGKVVGFVNGGPERTNDPDFVGEIYAIYVSDNCRRQGIGKSLFQRIIEFLLSLRMNSIKVWVLSDNPYRRFYERQGGLVIGEKPITVGETELMETAYGWTTYLKPSTIRRVRPDDCTEWLRMRQALWPDDAVQDLADDMQTWLQGQGCVVLVAERQNGGLRGFLEVAIRPCNVHGAVGQFGYFEGWYVDPDVRRLGIGKSLVEAAEAWVKDQGCNEILSDARIENALSHTAHQALGFVEVDRLIHFRKRLT